MLNDVTIETERDWLDLSLAQQSVWLDAKLSDASVYRLGGWARVAGPLDEAAVRQSVRLLMARHDALRLRVDDTLPRQWLDGSGESPITVSDLTAGTDADAAFRAYVDHAFADKMPLGDNPLFRIDVLRGEPNLHYVLWRFHHLIADSISVSMTLSYWFETYEALTSNTPGELSPGSSYLKTIAADANYLESAAYHQNLAYWATRFDPMPPQLIADLSAAPGGISKIAPVAERVLEGEEFAELERAAQDAGTTVQRALFALFAVTLGRRHGQTDIVSGVALHRRDLANRRVLGMMAGVIAVRCDFDPFWTLEECVQAFSEQVDADLRHQRLPIDVLSRSLGLSGTGRAGLFEVAMSYIPNDHKQSGSPVEGLPITTGAVDTKEASPISLHVAERADGAGVSVRIAVNTGFLEAAEAATLASLLHATVDRFVAERDTRFEDLNPVSPEERELVVEQWSRGKKPFALEAVGKDTLDNLFRSQAAKTPDALAVVGLNGDELTYAELDARSTYLARQLVAGGVQPERVIGVRMMRSAETIIALLAILKAGGAYLPLDPAYPSERLDYMASDADAMLVLDSIDFLGLPDERREADLPELPELTDPDRLAYVIYTSGTTGLPKGVAVAHAAAVNLAYARQACHDPLAGGDRVLAAISVGFDVSIGQLLLPLLSGATVVVVGEVKTMDAAEFWALLQDRRVTHINSVPSFFDSVLEAAPAAGTLALKRLMLGGEALSGALVERIQKALPGLEVVNMYGPTEACIDATFHIATEADLSATVLPIGRPLSNYRALILNSELAPVGVGLTGELYLGGAGLARGYVNAPELTSERFIPNPFSETHDSRLYRTGDRARWRGDGSIEFLGRGDAQIKIRGFRVEPGEIVAVLLGHPNIAQAVVVPVAANAAKAAGPLRLITYLVPRNGFVVPDAASLRIYLGRLLPEYMIPSGFVTVNAIPLNRNGKLDVTALPSPELESGEYVEPSTPTEVTVATLFAEVLGLGRCSANAHFFELGGHSLLATTLISKLRNYGWTVSLRAIFETPTVQMLSRRIDASLPVMQGYGPITPYRRPSEIPLSFSQERIWFVDRLQQDSSYNIPIAFALRGELDLSAVQQAIERIIVRHEVLRTRIVMRSGRPTQQIFDAAPLPLRQIDLASLEPQNRAAALEAKLAELVAYRFDLADEQPVVLNLISLAPDHHVLAAVVHHVAFDGWSAGIFLGEFAALYNGLVARKHNSLPELALQYADFALWQGEQDRVADVTFWLDELKDAPGLLELSSAGYSDEPIGQETTRLAGTHSFQLDPALHADLLKLASGAGASLFMVLHAAFALLLAQLSGSEDIVIGTVVANRSRDEFESLIGCFVNTLPLRTRFQVGEIFTSLLSRVRSADLAAYAHQELPFEQLVEALHPERSLEHTPIFQVLLVLQNAPLEVAHLPGLTIEPLLIEAKAAKFDLTLSIAEDASGLAGTLEFARNRFSSEFIVNLADKFERVLRAIIANPELDALTIDVLDPMERLKVIEEWNRTETPFPSGTLDGLFSAQANVTPEACAVVGADGQELSYARLDTRSNLLARHLFARGIRSGEVVGVRMERSSETVIALLAVLKAGGIYLPLDPAYPSDRLDYMAKDAGAVLVLDSLIGFEDGTVSGSDAFSIDPDPSRLAYIIYTSGTTGLPKGVAVSHRAAVNLAYARRAAHDPLFAGDRVLAGISVGFDVSIGQLLLPLLSGATVVIAGNLKTMGAAAFWSLISQREITHINTVPSFFGLMLDAAPSPGNLRLKRLMLGGEALSGALVARIQRVIPDLEVVNMYGPTEACIDATFYRATKVDHALSVLPIGRPLPNYRTYVLDKRMRPAVIGATGELYLGGDGLAQGYVNAPALTAERFVADPFSSSRSARIYRTGDRARWRADGIIEFLGRVDDQVKIRGFRVEPGEVETLLRKQPGVREAAVVAQAVEGSTRLLAYYTSEPARTTPEALRIALITALPDYMVPAAFIWLDHLPLSLNGKLDRKALPAPGQEAFATRLYEAPVGEIEQAMAELWAGLLKLERVGRHDNFFELGGHSLLAVTLMERIHQQGLPGDVRALFTTPTIAGLAAGAHSVAQSNAPENRIGQDCDAITPEMLPLVTLSQGEIDKIIESVPGGVKNVQDIYPLAPLQEGILFQHRMTSKGDPYLTPFLLGFDTRGILDDFVNALHQLMDRHDVLRTAFVWQEISVPVQVVLRRVALPVEEVTFYAVTQDVQTQLLSQFDPRTFRLDLTQAPLLRVVIAQDHTNDRWLLLLLTHHLIVDHTSLGILVHELRTLTQNSQAVLPSALPYRNFIAQIKQSSNEEHEKFFQQLLRDVDEPTAPFNVMDTRMANEVTLDENLVLDSDLADSIREQARVLGVTPASIFHLAWAAVLGHISSKIDVIFGTVLFGRMRSSVGADRAVGMFINTLPIRLHLDETDAVTSVTNAHRLLADLMTHEHAPLALAQHASAVPAPIPLFSSLFNYRYSAERGKENEWPGVHMVHAAERTNYPLAMAVDDSGTSFALTALTQGGIDPKQVCLYLQQGLTELIHLLKHAPTTPIRSLQVLPPAERGLIIDAWNATEAEYGSGMLDGLFRVQANATPDAIAVVGVDGMELTYSELDRQSSRLARQLLIHGVSLQSVVGVRMERSTSTVICMLGILKAGAVYLPLDPAYPADRLQYMAVDAGAVLILDSLEQFKPGLDVQTAEDLLPFDGKSDASRLAYIIYTSGTTGLPKGVAVEHRAAVNLAFARRTAHDPLGTGDRVLAAISVGFDVSIGQLFLPLLAGATVIIAGDLKTMGASDFWTLLAKRHVTHINSVPSFVDSILDAAPAAGTLALKRLMLGGEALTGALVARIQRALPGLEVVNMYGPTETCIDATYYAATSADHNAAVLPIGCPLPNYRAYVLNSRMQPVGIGVSGELYLGGAGLARGYVNAPELTDERFIANPFSTMPEARLYCTGDLARRRTDGMIEFLGRVDSQVKIRGFRVEPGEIESHLIRQKGIREAAVVADSAGGSMRLIAYYTGDEAQASSILREALTTSLPDYMVPAAFVKLQGLPLTPNGKLDRKALPAPEQSAFVARLYEAPIGETEHKLAVIWAELLKVDRIGRHDNFFELGGHSLLAVTLIERMRQQHLPGDVLALFTTPTIAGLAVREASSAQYASIPENGIAKGSNVITPEMLPLVTLTQQQIDSVVASVPGGAANVQDIYPLAPLQEGILFQHLVTTVGDLYLSPLLIAFEQRSQLDGFLQALRHLVLRHDVLRTAMIWKDVSEPVQIVLRHVEFPVLELTLDAASLNAEQQLLTQFDPRVFRLDLSQAPLLRAVITYDEPNARWLLLLLTHHLILDHTSLEILVDELRTLVVNPRAVLSLPLPYRNFIAQTRQGITATDHKDFFERMLSDVDEPTAPFGILALQANTDEPREGRLTLPPALATTIRVKAAAMGVTPASLFHLAWAAVLGHISGKSDVVFGTVLFGRMRSAAGADRVVGMFINTLPLRIRLNDTSVAASVLHIHRLLAELLSHEHAPLALAQRASGVPAPAPLFSSLFNYRYNRISHAGTTWSGVDVIRSTESTNYPLAMAVEDSATDFTLIALASSSISPDRVCGYLGHALTELMMLLERARETPINLLSVVPPIERTLVLEQFNQTAVQFQNDTLHGLFSAQAHRTPSTVAIIGTDTTEFTYAELDERSTMLARQLIAHGVSRSNVVGVQMERSMETIVALLAILKAGGVYLPLDPAYPADRLAYMASDAGAVLVLKSLDYLPGDCHAELSELPTPGKSDDIAYVIYTSGTTGLPKGVAVAHSAAVNLAFGRRSAHDPLGPGDRVLAAISVGFDVSIGQLLLPLLAGATVVIAGELKTTSPIEFWTLLADRGVTHINSVPSFLDSILDAVPRRGMLKLKRLMLGGEALAGSLVARIHRAIPGVEVVNMYGPTEACIDATFHLATEADYAAPVLPIGRPLPNTSAYILDSRLQPVGIGVSGELYLGGLGLARGYINTPELTAERFILNPFSTEPGARLYRTGDRARRRSDGAIEFLGRMDNQIKIRGFRVEPGEIEAQLKKQPGIREAIILPQTTGGTTRLIAYYTGEYAVPIQFLRSSLAAALPDYMVPASFIQMEHLPLTLNGKLDRGALPSAGQDFLASSRYEAPIGEREERMSSLWAEMLKLDRVGRHDNFFELGGDSLGAMRLVGGLSAAFQVTVSVRSLFQYPTVEALTSEISSEIPSHRSRSLIPLRAGGTKPKLFMMHGLTGHVFHYMAIVRALGPDQPVYGLQATGLEDGELPATSIEEIATDYVHAIQTIQPNGPYHLLGYSSGGLLAFEMAQQFRKLGEEVHFLALLDTSVPDPSMDREVPDEVLGRELAEALGLADLLAGGNSLPTIAGLVEMARKAGRLPEDLQTTHLERMAAVFRNTVRTCPDYHVRTWKGPMLLVRATNRPPEAALPDWFPYVRGPLQVVDCDCTHLGLINAEMATVVASAISLALAPEEIPSSLTYV